MTRIGAALVLVLVAMLASPSPFPAADAWPQFGGPGRDFHVETSGVAAWGSDGRTTLWERELGEGYSGIVASGGTLYTMYRPLAWFGVTTRDEEVAVAIDATTGKTLWEQRNPVEYLPAMRMEHGPGPHATPLLAGGRVFTAGTLGRLQALAPETGKVVWAHELWKDLGGTVMDRGYSCSPLAWKDTVIVAVGGRRQSLMAFDQKDGTVRWKGGSFVVSPSSPVIVSVGGQEQIVFFGGEKIVGLDPATGKPLWSHPHATQYKLNIALPVSGEDWPPRGLLRLQRRHPCPATDPRGRHDESRGAVVHEPDAHPPRQLSQDWQPRLRLERGLRSRSDECGGPRHR